MMLKYAHKIDLNLPIKFKLELEHFKQRSNWDCGISCILMVLPKNKRQLFLDNFLNICKEEGFGRSTWTIDLCYLLKKFQIPHTFYTTTLGVHPGYEGHSFYSNILNKDEERIDQRFKNAKSDGIEIIKTKITLSQIITHLSKGPVIVLTNSRLLTCDICKLNKVKIELRKCIPWPVDYQGHYIVLCGYDLSTYKIYYRNPTFNKLCVMSLKSLEDARKSYGTDEDIIFIET